MIIVLQLVINIRAKMHKSAKCTYIGNIPNRYHLGGMCYQLGGCVVSLRMCYQFVRGCVISLCTDVLSVWGMCYQFAHSYPSLLSACITSVVVPDDGRITFRS